MRAQIEQKAREGGARLVIGLAESFSIAYVSSTFADLVVFAILIIVMLVRPTGLLGKADIKKV